MSPTDATITVLLLALVVAAWRVAAVVRRVQARRAYAARSRKLLHWNTIPVPIHSVDLHMWSGPEWDAIRKAMETRK